MIEGKIEDPAILRFRFALGSGSFTYPDGTEGKWDLTINVDSKLIFMQVKGKGKVAYSTYDMLMDTLEILGVKVK